MLKNTTSFIDASIFRAYDVRGIVDVTLTENNIALIGKAFASSVREAGEHQITIARDGRISSARLFKVLRAAIQSTGCNVVDIGVVPTPLLYFALSIFSQKSGLMITGSHNPPEYNGLKMVAQGRALSPEDIRLLYERAVDGRFYSGHGACKYVDVLESYLAYLQQDIHLNHPLKIVVDAGNGISGKIAPLLYRLLGCEVHELFCEIDGHFPHHHPDPSQPENLKDLVQAVQKHNADLGLAFDGDGDRLGVVTPYGEIILPDRLLMVFAKVVLSDHPQAKIIYDVKCTRHLDAHIRANNGIPIMWKTGHSLIKSKMVETGALLGGEMSGHFFFRDRWYGFDDALYAGARLLEILAAQNKSADALFADVPNTFNTPEIKISVAEEEKFKLMEQLIAKASLLQANDLVMIDGLRADFAEGWGLVRPSNTTPCLVLRFEAINEPILEKIKSIFRNWLLSVKADLILPF